MRPPILCRAAILLIALAGCGTLLPPRSTAPPPAPNDASAWVVFLAADQRRLLNVTHTVRDEEGAILGRLRGRSWFAVERPPGTQWFFVGNDNVHLRSPDRGTTDVGALSAQLDAGRVYLVRVANYEGARRSIVEQFRNHSGRSCLWADEDDDGRPEYVDLVGVRPGGTEWLRALDVLRTGVRYEPAPRGLEEGRRLDVVLGGRARLDHCLDIERSTLRPDDGSPFWPLSAADPSIEGAGL